MSLVVIDASTVAAWCLPSQYSPLAESLLRQAKQHRFLAPHVLLIEVRSLFLAAERRGPWGPTDTEASLADLEGLEISIVRMDDGATLASVLGLARSARLSVYHALYLQLALTDGGVLASRDKALIRAAALSGVSTMDMNP